MTVTPITTTAGLRAFMSELIDYAGLFPPAKLPLPDAFTDFNRYRTESDQWMLSRFIIPARRLADLTALGLGDVNSNQPIRFSILGTGGNDTDAFHAALSGDVTAVTQFREAHGAAVALDVYEVKLPLDALTNIDSIQKLLSKAGKLLNAAGLTMPFYEVPRNADWMGQVTTVAQAIAAYIDSADHPAGFKLRCGGVEAAQFPSPAQVAHAIIACRDARVRLKATAGLHHPVRHYSDDVQTRMHGFLNVFGAGILAQVHDLNADEVEDIISDEDPAHFIFDEVGFTWRNLTATVEQVQAARDKAVLSYGSCSFDEPRDDLQALGLLP